MPVSRQREWQKKMRATGRCTICGKPQAKDSATLCAVHQEIHRKQARTRKQKRYGYRPWRPGSRGHAPLDWKENTP